nr:MULTISPECIES: hypothetical protein [unclassified Pseudomonas]
MRKFTATNTAGSKYNSIGIAKVSPTTKPPAGCASPAAYVGIAKLAKQDLKRFQDQLAQYSISLEIRPWEVPSQGAENDSRKKMKRAYAAVSSQREVRSDLSLIYFRIMRELAVENDVPSK